MTETKTDIIVWVMDATEALVKKDKGNCDTEDVWNVLNDTLAYQVANVMYDASDNEFGEVVDLVMANLFEKREAARDLRNALKDQLV